MPRPIAFVTYDREPGGTADDALAVAALAVRGVPVMPTSWNDAQVDWSRFELVVIRSPWDYFIVPDAFQSWLARLEAARVRLLNPLPVLRWNMDKRYLRELESAGIAIPPTRWLSRGERANLAELLSAVGWRKAVLKPVISGGAFDTETVTPDSAAATQPRLDALLEGRDMMLQRYMEEIETEGEWSLLFFNRRFSHAVLKRPATGDFRVQSQHGGTTETRAVAPEVIAAADAILARVEGPLLYARVDGLLQDGRFVLIELEILEPALFLAQADGAPARFADALLEHL